jgi:hypothetical protein
MQGPTRHAPQVAHNALEGRAHLGICKQGGRNRCCIHVAMMLWHRLEHPAQRGGTLNGGLWARASLELVILQFRLSVGGALEGAAQCIGPVESPCMPVVFPACVQGLGRGAVWHCDAHV